MWSQGILSVPIGDDQHTDIEYCCKHFEEPSKFGIEGGRISKLMLRQNGRVVYNYDRGLDIEPQTAEAELALSYLMDEYN